MEELLMCSVCIERYHEKKRHPVLLPRCGHSFCRPCVSMLISAGCIVCPTCRTDQRVDFVERLPTEYTLLAIINAQENNMKETCERHSVKLSFWCRSCEIATCGECLFEDHPTHTHDVIRSIKYIQDMKDTAQDVALKFIEVLDEREQGYYRIIFNCTRKISGAIRNIGALRKDIEEARSLMKGIKEDESISAATSLSEAAKFLGLKWNIQDANLQRKAKEEQVKDEIDLEKERAQKEAAAKEQEEKATAAKEKTKESKKVLRKSKTLSNLEMTNELQKAENGDDPKEKRSTGKDKESAKVTSANNRDGKRIKEVVKTTEDSKVIEPLKSNQEEIKTVNPEKKDDITTAIENKDMNGEKETKQENLNSKETRQVEETQQREPGKTEEKRALKETVKTDQKTKEVAKNGEKVIKEPKEEFSIKDIIKMKDQLRKTDIGSFDDLKAKDKPKLKVPKIKPFVKKIQLPTIEGKNQSESLSAIQEKDQENTPGSPDNPESPEILTSSAASATSGTPASSGTPEKEVQEIASHTTPELVSIESTDDEEEGATEVQAVEPGSKANQGAVNVEEESINSDSGLSEDSKKTKAKVKEPIEDIFNEEKLMDYIQVPGFMICVEAADGRLAALQWGPQGLHVHCLQFTHVTYDIVIRDTLLNSFIPSKSPTVFLEVSADHTILGRVYIKLWGHLRRAHNFLSLCLGDQGKSYMNTKFLQVYNIGSSGERILGGDYESNNGRGGKGLLDELEWNGDYAMPMKAGMITAAGTGNPANNSLFLICSQSDSMRNFSCPFGIVYEGLKVIKEAVQQTATKQVWITDCGVVLVPPRLDP